MNRNLKIFVSTGIPFGIFMAILFSLCYGINVGLSSGLIAGLIFGFLMYIILGFLHSRAVQKIAGDKIRRVNGDLSGPKYRTATPL